jgi:hypothetical protein
MATTYEIIIHDATTSNKRIYKSIDGAMKRFQELTGMSVDAAILERWPKSSVKKTAYSVKEVGKAIESGAVVIFKRNGDAEPEQVKQNSHDAAVI